MEKFIFVDGFNTNYPIYAESKDDFLNSLVIAISKTASKMKVVGTKYKNLTGHEIDSGYFPDKDFIENKDNNDFFKLMNELLNQYTVYQRMKVCKNYFDYFEFRYAFENKQIDKDKNILTIDEYFEKNTIA